MGITTGFVWLRLKEVMYKGILRLAVVLIAALLNMAAAQASYYSGGFLGGKFGINNSTATGTIYDTGASTFAYGVQGGYLQGGYNWDMRAALVGVGAYADFNSNEIHVNKMEYGSRALGLDAKLGVPLDDWLIYTKVGYGYSAGTNDLSAVSQYSSNVAVGVEYSFVFAFRWGAIIEYKLDNFSNRDGSISINNKTLAFGLNYYFDRPEVAPVAKVAEVDLNLEPLPEPDPDLEDEPPPDIGSGGADSTATKDPESWKLLLAGQAVRIEGANFISDTTKLMSVVTKELDETADFAAKYPYAILEVNGYSDGPAKQNLKLSVGRAEAIKNYLVAKGVAAKRISFKSKGPADPIADNNTEEGRAINRRVEIFAVINVWKTLLKNKPVVIESTNFVPETAKLKQKVGNELDAVAGFAGKYPDAKLEMTGYSDTTNPALSLELADSVRNYLVTKGVADSRITIKGEGSAKPVGDNKTKEGRAKNRRVEIHSVVKDENKVPVAATTPVLTSNPKVVPITAPAAKTASTPATASVPVSWKILLEAKPVLINIEGTSFVSGSGIPNARIGKNLDEVVRFAAKYPETKFELTGYTDSRGSEKKNLELSLARAESVKNYLVTKGVSSNRITIKGAGSANPVGDNKTKEGRAKNRRVEIHSVIKEENKGLVVAPAAAPVPIPVPAIAISTDPVSWKSLLENKPVSIESTNFVPGTIKLKPEAGMELGAVVGFASKYPDAKLEITGYSDINNPALSLGLADSVRDYLVTKGVSGNRIAIKGAGSANPVGDNKTKEGRAKNRRVEIHSENKGLVAAPASAPVPASVPVPTPQASPEADSWKAFWPPNERRGR